MKKKVTLVLGAGSSVALGYPVGSDLRKMLIKNIVGTHLEESIINSKPGLQKSTVQDFVKEFKTSQMESIDAFLARRPDYSDIGRRCIAALLLSIENKEKLHDYSEGDTWYRYFFNNTISLESWDSLDLSHLSIVTFNYDRSFEHYLAFAIMPSYQKTLVEAFRKIHEIKIIHIYGQLGATNPENDSYFEYGSGPTQSNIDVASSMIRVIPEGRQDDEILSTARSILLESDRIAFLGFGFDKVNLERLDARNTCVVNGHAVGKTNNRVIWATSLGMTEAEITRARNMSLRNHSTGGDKDRFMDLNCLSLLRETLILDELF